MIRRLLLVLLALLVLAGAALGWLYTRTERAEPVPAASPAPLAERVARGAYLVRVGDCMLCHTARGGAPFAGGRPLATPFGTIYSSNLTPARAGLAGWTAEDFWRAMHHGRSREGRMLYPAFPYQNFTQVTRADTDAIFAYLGTLAPVERANTPHDLRWPFSTQPALAVWRALYFRPATYQAEPAKSAEWNRGAYLVRGLAHCSACHSTRNALGASDLMDLSGGLIPMQSWYAPSLTSRAEAGVANWPTEKIVKLLGTGATEDGGALGPMAEVVLHSTQHFSQADLTAMATFLKDLPQTDAPAAGAVQAVPSRVAERGQRLYGEHCASCHGDDGKGVPGAYPPLAGNRAVTMPVTANLVQVVMRGGFPPATQGNPQPFGMPPFALVLSDADVTAVLSYIRNAWGNRAGLVSDLDVSRGRSSGS